MLFPAFQPQTTGQIKKVTSSERTRISYFTALTRATYVVLPKENHMQLTEAATLDRKSGGAEGSAVPRTFPGNAEPRSATDGPMPAGKNSLHEGHGFSRAAPHHATRGL